MGETLISQPSPVEPLKVKLAGPAGLYFMQVSAPTQHQVLKLIKS